MLATIPLTHCLPGHSSFGKGHGIPKLGAVASESSVCSKIGINLIQDGGNAADALVGTVFCVGVIGMYHSGIGGGGFMLARSSNGTYEFIDFRETAPAAAFEDMYKNNTQASIFGGLARYVIPMPSIFWHLRGRVVDEQICAAAESQEKSEG